MPFIKKFVDEAKFVNGVSIAGIYSEGLRPDARIPEMRYTESRAELLSISDAVYVVSKPEKHYADITEALNAGKHVLCESPVTESGQECRELFELAASKGLILMDAIKTAYSTAYERLVLLAKSGKIGRIVSVDAVCTSLQENFAVPGAKPSAAWNAICGWGPYAMLPVMQILGTDYTNKTFFTKFLDREANLDAFTKIDFAYPSAVASIKVAKGAKSEGTLIVTGTNGYIYVPAPWWKTDYFEVRYEDQAKTNRFFYQLEGEGIRYEIVVFAKSVELAKWDGGITENESEAMCKIIGDFNARKDMIEFC